MVNDFYKREELENLGFKKIGLNVSISKKASIYSAEDIEIGDNVRIDDFCILSGKIKIGSYIHISAYSGIFAGSTGVEIGDFCTISSRNMIYAESDDYSGASMTNPMVSNVCRKVEKGRVILNEYCIIGTGCTILPGVNIGEGAAVGAMSLVKKDLEEWKMYYGIPVRMIRDREKKLLEYIEKELY